MLSASEYDAVAAQASLGSKLEGKRAELEGLRDQMRPSTSTILPTRCDSSRQIAQTREESLRASLATIQRQTTELETLQAQMAQGLGDFKVRENLYSPKWHGS